MIHRVDVLMFVSLAWSHIAVQFFELQLVNRFTAIWNCAGAIGWSVRSGAELPWQV